MPQIPWNSSDSHYGILTTKATQLSRVFRTEVDLGKNVKNTRPKHHIRVAILIKQMSLEHHYDRLVAL